MGNGTGFFLRVFAALYESRQRQAALEIKRHAHVIDEAAAYAATRLDNLPAEAELVQFKRAS